MKIHVACLVLAFCGTCSLERNEGPGFIHRLRKRQVSAEDLGPVPYVAREQYAPLPYQQHGAEGSSSSSGAAVEAAAAAAADDDAASNRENDDPRANRDFANSGYGGYVDYSHRPSSVSSQIAGRSSSSSADSSSSSSSSSSSADPSRGGRVPYYRYQPPVSSGYRPSSGSSQSSHGQSSSHGHFSASGSSQFQPGLSGGSQSGGGVPSQSHVAGFTRYTFSSQPSSSSSSSQSSSSSSSSAGGGGGGLGSRSQSGVRTFGSPFSHLSDNQPDLLVHGGVAGLSSGDVAGSASAADAADRTPVGLVRQDGAGGAGAGGNQASVVGDEEPVVEVFPSERPVVNPRSSEYQERLRQRELELQRRMQQRRQHQAAAAAAAGGGAGGAGGNDGAQQRRPISSSSSSSSSPSFSSSSSSSGQQIRPIYTGSYPLGVNYGQPILYGGQQPHQQRGQHNRFGGGYGAGGFGVGGGGVGRGLQQPIYGLGQGQPVYGGRGRRPQLPYNYGNYGYSQGGVNAGDYDSQCPNTGIRIQINGIPCDQAVDHYGSYLCYRHEYTSRECCLRCRGLKNPARVGCEYGDHSGRCQQINPYDCYDLRNRQSCCQSCERMRIPGARSGCEYGDMTPNCDQVRQNPGLCYIPENRHLCCQTCSTIRVTEDPECPWGDQNSDLCQPFDHAGHIRINCYAPPIKRICCQACRRLSDWIRTNQPGCEYGDRPVSFNTGSHRNLNCTSFMRYYGYDQCAINQAVATNCCYTCHRYRQG